MRAVFLLVLVLGILGCCHASRNQWVNLHQAPTEVEHRFSIALKQRNVDAFTQLFEEISTPQSPKYAQYLGIHEIADILAPEPANIRAVISFLKQKSPKADIRLHVARDALLVKMPVQDVEDIFQVSLSRFQSKRSANVITRSEKMYTIPSDIAPFIDMISMISDFPASKISLKPNPSQGLSTGNGPVFGYPQASDTTLYAQITPICKNNQKTKDAVNPCSDNAPAITSFQTYVVNNWTSETAGSNKISTPIKNGACEVDGGAVVCSFVFNERPVVPYDLYTISIVSNFADGTSSNTSVFPTSLVTSAFVTPQLLWSQYKAPLGSVSHGANQSVAEFGQQYYSPTDLTYFLGNMSLPAAPTSLVGPNNAAAPGDEATLDIQWIMAAAPGAPTVFWSVGHDEYLYEWALQVQQSPNRPLVHSISYGGNEGGSPLAWRNRVDTELMKLGTLGLSVVVASGDAGATDVGHGFDACTPLQPQYPSGSPYVTTVSATFFTPKSEPICYNSFFEAPIHCSQKSLGEVGVAANIGMDWTTGGGFSNSTTRPSWQETAVSSFFKQYSSTLPPSYLFNSNGRAYPDVSAVGHNLVIVMDGAVDVADGTSAATPIFAGFLTRINDFLLANNKPPLGFANPLLYQVAAAYPQAFYDVTVGSNNCGDVLHPPYVACCPYGYQCTQGWDPVTGLGTPVYDNLLKGVASILNIPL